MSAFPHDPDHFWRWMNTRYPGEQTGKESFVPRLRYGAYLSDLLSDATARATRLTIVSTRIIDAAPVPEGLRIDTEAGESFCTSALVLALGNFVPAPPRGLDEDVVRSNRYIASPWQTDALSRIGSDDEVLIVGSGLTALDVLLSLEEQGSCGRIHLLSRRGLLPIAHRAHSALPQLFARIDLPVSIRALTRRLREEAAAIERRGGDWRAVVDAFRPRTQNYWRRLSDTERRRFLRHVRPFWEAHRHRVAPEVLAVISRLRARNQLTLYKARLEQIRAAGAGLRVSIFDRRECRSRQFTVDFVINCTGPQSDYRKLNDQLAGNLLRRGLVVPDPLGLGIQTTADGRVKNKSGTATLFAIGSARKADLYETTAVPELRLQAAEIATEITAMFSRNGKMPE
jgi:uncharacterized NAD(P)/FAD-binding protein YdhS